MAIVEASLSDRGSRDVASVIDLEPILGALEREVGRATFERRDPALYWFAVFGDLGEGSDGAGAAPWSWRIGGHHVAIQVTVADGRVIASSPSFLGANPAVVPRTCGRCACLDRGGVAGASAAGGLTTRAAAVAIVDPVAPPDIRERHAAGRADVRGSPGRASA